MRILLLILIVVFSLSCENKKKSKTVHGFSKDKLNNIDSYAQSLIENNELPGVVVMVKKGDDLIYFKGFGYSDARFYLNNNKINFKYNSYYITCDNV